MDIIKNLFKINANKFELHDDPSNNIQRSVMVIVDFAVVRTILAKTVLSK